MTAFGHAEAHERLMDLTLEPGALRRFAMALADGGESAMTDPLLAHVGGCATCRDTLASWKRTHDTVRHVLTGGSQAGDIGLADLADDEHIVAPAALRSALLELVDRAPERARPPTAIEGHDRGNMARARPARLFRWRSQPGRRWLGLVAAFGIVAIAGGLVLDQSTRLDQARRETAALEAVATTLDRVLRDPGHVAVDLRAADGTPAGSISWSSRDFVVLTSGLQPPPAGSIYACWIERDGVRTPVGQMWFAGGTAFWTGSLDGWATTSFGSGTFGISLEPVDGARGHPAVLVGDLGS